MKEFFNKKVLIIFIILNVILLISRFLPNDIFSIVEIIYILIIALLIGYKNFFILSIILLLLINIICWDKKIFIYSILEVVLYILFKVLGIQLEIMVEYNEKLDIVKQFTMSNIGIIFDIILVLIIVNIVKKIKKKIKRK